MGPASAALKEKQPMFSHSSTVWSYSLSQSSVPKLLNQRLVVDLVASSELWTLFWRLLPPGVLGSWGSPGWSIMERWKGSSTDSGVPQESSCPAHLGFLGRTTQPGILSQPLFLYFSLTADNEPGMESSAKRKDALPHGVSPTH